MQLVIFIALLIVWQFPVFNPLKLLVVLFHEMSHVCVAYLTGGIVFGIAIDPGGAGVTLGMGGNRLMVLAAGYLGSLIVGIVLYGLSAVWRARDVWLVLILFSWASLLMGWLNSFTAVFGFGTLILTMVAAVVLTEEAKQVLLRILGTACCLYPVIDVSGELWGVGLDGFVVQGRYIGSDVIEMSRLVGLPWGVVAALWALMGFALLAFLVTWSVRLEARNEVKRELFYRHRVRETKRRMRIYNPNDPSTIPEYTIR